MRSKVAGKVTLGVEITNIDMKGIWLLLEDKEFFLPFEEFPGFRDATVRQIHNVCRVNDKHLRWPDLGLEFSLERLGNPQHVPVY